MKSLFLPAFAAAVLVVSAAHATPILGEFYDLSETPDSIDNAKAFADSTPADATFDVSAINYPKDFAGTNYLSSGSLGGFLGSDAETLSDPAEASTTLAYSLFRFSGMVGLNAGINDLSIELDDRFALYLDGELVESSDDIVPRRLVEFTADGGAGGVVPFELFYYENGGSAYVQFIVNDSFVGEEPSASAVPLPATLPLAAVGLGLLGWVSWRRAA